MKQKNLLILSFFFLLPALSRAQNVRELVGRVVEIRDGQAVGVAKITVSIVDFDYDVTDAEGYFKLPLPPDRDHVSIVLENTPSKMVSPYSGVVNLPPERNFQIVVCGEENRRLAEKVSKLNSDIKKLEKAKKLSSMQLQAMHHALLDTIIHFEKQIGGLKQTLQESGEENAALAAELAARDERIRALEESERNLVAALSEALKEKFLHQKKYFDGVSADLTAYLDRLKELRDRCTPSQLPYPFRSPQASEQLGKKINEYNEVRNAIMKNHHLNHLGVQEYWDNPDVAEHLEATYSYLLKEVHEGLVMPIDERVFGQVREVAAHRVGAGRAQKNAEAAAKELLPDLNRSIEVLEMRIQQTISLLATNI